MSGSLRKISKGKKQGIQLCKAVENLSTSERNIFCKNMAFLGMVRILGYFIHTNIFVLVCVIFSKELDP